MLTFLLVKLLKGLDEVDFRPRPKGTGQKSINVAAGNGWIESRKSSAAVPLPDLHRLTPWGARVARKIAR